MKIEIYGAHWCSFCNEAVSLCKSKAIDYEYIDVDDTANLRSLEERIGAKVRSVPQIFCEGELVQGGFGGLQSLVMGQS